MSDIIWGIDPGLANTGIATSSYNKPMTIVTKSTLPINHRLDYISRSVVYFAEQHGSPDYIFIERAYGGKLITVQYAIGAMLSCFPKANVTLVAPIKWVKQLFGSQNSGAKGFYKRKAMRYARDHGYNPLTQHEADAIGLMLYGLEELDV